MQLKKRKLTLMLIYKAIQGSLIAVGDLVRVSVKKGKSERGQWTDNRPILAFDLPYRRVTVPGARGRKMMADI